MKKIRWGILSTAKIGIRSVIPGLRAGELGEVVAISSRDAGRAAEVAHELGIGKSYGSYEELLADPEIDAVYNPLPNNLHVPWSIRALEAGKHVLCEKPIAVNAQGARELLEHSRRHPELKVMEAFMYRHHPQWRKSRELVQNGAVGKLRTVHSFFTFHNTNPKDIRNQEEMGGGGLLDIGCYCVSLSRFLWDAEPVRALGLVEFDPELGVDRLASAILEFPEGTSTFTCATQLAPYQRVQALGDGGRLEIDRPFNAPPDMKMKLRHERGGQIEELTLPAANQYALQGDLFARSILDGSPVPVPLEDAVANMRVIDAIFASARSGGWVSLSGG